MELYTESYCTGLYTHKLLYMIPDPYWLLTMGTSDWYISSLTEIEMLTCPKLDYQ